MRSVFLSLAIFTLFVPAIRAAESVTGTYVEARTCQVYTGPCFANGEIGSAGKQAVMVWKMIGGSSGGVDLSGQSVAVVVRASHTMGFRGLNDATSRKAIVVVNASADDQTAAALRDFVRLQTGLQDEEIVAAYTADIAMEFDLTNLTAAVTVDGFAHLEARKARKGDCICSNESAYYPPLTALRGFVPGVTIEGEISARRLGSRWSIPDSRTAYLGTFAVDEADLRVAGNL